MQTTHFRTITSKLLLVLASVTLGISACNSDGTEIAEQDPPETATTTTTTTATTTSTTVTTTSTTETSLAETALAETERPEFEIQTEWESDLEEIFGRYRMYWEALYIATGPPFADPDYAPLLDLLDPGVVQDVQTQIQGFRDGNAVVLRPEDSLDDHGLRLPNPAPLGKTEGNRVVIQDCWIRDDIVRTLDEQTDTEHFQTLLWNVDMIVMDGEWRYYSANEAGPDSDGYQECQDLFDTLER